MIDARLPRRHSLRAQAGLIFVLLALIPAGLVGVLLVDVNRDAVETSERQLQAAVLSEITAAVEQQVFRVQDELLAIANAIMLEVKREGDTDDNFAGVRAALAAGQEVRAVRFEVPEAHVATELRARADRTPLPHATAAALATARSDRLNFTRDDAGQALLIVPVALGGASPSGYVSSPLDVGVLRRELEATARSRFGGSSVRVLVVDNALSAVASSGLEPAAEADARNAEVWKLLPPPSAWTLHFSVVGSHREADTEMLGAVETVPQLGWGVALWRPQAEAYASLDKMKTRATTVALLSVVLAFCIGLITAGRLTAPLLAMAEQARCIGARAWTSLKPLPKIDNELGELGASLEAMAAQLQAGEREIAHQARLRSELGRYMNHQLVERIVSGEHSVALGGARAIVSVLFADVVGFTPLTEQGPPERVVGLLNELFSLLTEIVLRNGGIVDKFLGDSVMAIFGAPEPTELHARQALRAAEEMLRFVASSNDDWAERYGTRIRLAIGVSSGECTLGNVGSNKRMEYTAIGDVVNIAARLEALAAADQVLLTDSTRRAAGDGFDYVSLGEQQITGRQMPVAVFALQGSA